MGAGDRPLFGGGPVYRNATWTADVLFCYEGEGTVGVSAFRSGPRAGVALVSRVWRTDSSSSSPFTQSDHDINKM
jgi:hypothetical protein